MEGKAILAFLLLLISMASADAPDKFLKIASIESFQEAPVPKKKLAPFYPQEELQVDLECSEQSLRKLEELLQNLVASHEECHIFEVANYEKLAQHPEKTIEFQERKCKCLERLPEEVESVFTCWAEFKNFVFNPVFELAACTSLTAKKLMGDNLPALADTGDFPDSQDFPGFEDLPAFEEFPDFGKFPAFEEGADAEFAAFADGPNFEDLPDFEQDALKEFEDFPVKSLAGMEPLAYADPDDVTKKDFLDHVVEEIFGMELLEEELSEVSPKYKQAFGNRKELVTDRGSRLILKENREQQFDESKVVGKISVESEARGKISDLGEQRQSLDSMDSPNFYYDYWAQFYTALFDSAIGRRRMNHLDAETDSGTRRELRQRFTGRGGMESAIHRRRICRYYASRGDIYAQNYVARNCRTILSCNHMMTLWEYLYNCPHRRMMATTKEDTDSDAETDSGTRRELRQRFTARGGMESAIHRRRICRYYASRGDI